MRVNKMFQEFGEMYGMEKVAPNTGSLINAHALIRDEVYELEEELHGSDLRAAAKEMTDIIYITAERMTNMGFDVEALLAEVHRSNMSKRVHTLHADEELAYARIRYPEAKLVQLDFSDFMVIRDQSTGKVVKPRGYSKASITPEMIGYPSPVESNIDMIEVLNGES